MAQMITSAVSQAAANFVEAIRLFLPRVVTTLSIVLAGWLIAAALRLVVRWILGWLRFNAACERAGLAQMLKAADLPQADVLVSRMVFWIVWIGFLLSGVDVLGFTVLEGLMASFILFIPRLVIAVAIFVAGLLAANFLWRATLLTAVNAHAPSPRLLAGAARWLVLILAGAMALDQIAVARTIVLTAFAIAFGAVMLGLAIAFGIGGGHVARRFLDRQFPGSASERAPDDVSHL
jgi:hypothetical protein